MTLDDVLAHMRDTVLLLSKRSKVEPSKIDVGIMVDGSTNAVTATATIRFPFHERGLTVSGPTAFDAINQLRGWAP